MATRILCIALSFPAHLYSVLRYLFPCLYFVAVFCGLNLSGVGYIFRKKGRNASNPGEVHAKTQVFRDSINNETPMKACYIPVTYLSQSSCHTTTNYLMSEILYRKYLGEADLPHIMDLVQSELSEPYVIYTFRYFLHHW